MHVWCDARMRRTRGQKQQGSQQDCLCLSRSRAAEHGTGSTRGARLEHSHGLALGSLAPWRVSGPALPYACLLASWAAAAGAGAPAAAVLCNGNRAVLDPCLNNAQRASEEAGGEANRVVADRIADSGVAGPEQCQEQGVQVQGLQRDALTTVLSHNSQAVGCVVQHQVGVCAPHLKLAP